jgi:hypothetical protein
MSIAKAFLPTGRASGCPTKTKQVVRKNYRQLVIFGFKAALLVIMFVSLFLMSGLFLS